jgi:molybdopterin synthase catalytic subunit
MTSEAKDDNDWILLTYESLDISNATSYVSSSSTGAISVFLGTTRDHFEGRVCYLIST